MGATYSPYAVLFVVDNKAAAVDGWQRLSCMLSVKVSNHFCFPRFTEGNCLENEPIVGAFASASENINCLPDLRLGQRRKRVQSNLFQTRHDVRSREGIYESRERWRFNGVETQKKMLASMIYYFDKIPGCSVYHTCLEHHWDLIPSAVRRAETNIRSISADSQNSVACSRRRYGCSVLCDQDIAGSHTS